jgi:hypothetical protein
MGNVLDNWLADRRADAKRINPTLYFLEKFLYEVKFLNKEIEKKKNMLQSKKHRLIGLSYDQHTKMIAEEIRLPLPALILAESAVIEAWIYKLNKHEESDDPISGLKLCVTSRKERIQEINIHNLLMQLPLVETGMTFLDEVALLLRQLRNDLLTI